MTTREDLLSRLARARALRDAATPEPWTHNLPDNAPSPDEECTSFAVASLGGCGCCGSPWVKHGDGVLMAAAPDLVTLAEDLAAALERAESERDSARQDLSRCYVLAGWDTDGNTPETGWIHIYSGAVDAVAELRQTYDEGLDAILAAEKAAEELAALREERDRLARMLATASAFEVSPMTVKARQLGSIRVERCGQLDGPDLWAVRQRGNVLSVDGKWEYEPIPSSRDDDFLARCRFATLEEATEAANAAMEADRAR